jgi:hypothetical protein
VPGCIASSGGSGHPYNFFPACELMAGVLFLLLTARLVATPQWQSSCQIAATPLVGQQIQRSASQYFYKT